MQDTTWKNYHKLLANPSEFESFTIEPDYTVNLLEKTKKKPDGTSEPGFNKAKNLSAGQSLLLTLAFVAAIREPTGYKFPLIVDSPAGKVDGPNTHNIGKCLPEFLPDAQLALLATNLWRNPLPKILKENVMDPIGASNTWRWHGYKNSWIVLDGQNIQSVSGGGHWGGGMFINALDHARFGYLFLRNGDK